MAPLARRSIVESVIYSKSMVSPQRKIFLRFYVEMYEYVNAIRYSKFRLVIKLCQHETAVNNNSEEIAERVLTDY